MLNICQIKNRCFSSNTYILHADDTESVWLIDCGDYDQIRSFCSLNGKRISGIFITHGHFDHVYGINEVVKDYPDIPVYLAAKGGIEILSDERKNGSRYAEMPFRVTSCNFIELQDAQEVELLKGVFMKAFSTQGHSLDSLSYYLFPYLFTGDAFIPNIRTVSKLKSGNRLEAKNTVLQIYHEFSKDVIICPGHNDICRLGDVDVEKMI